MKKLTSETINWLRIMLVILVLWVHVHPDHNSHWLTMNSLAGQEAGWVLFSVIGTFLNKLGFIAVPLFFTISGYLFFQKLETWSWTVWKQKVRTRVRTLLVPYLIFNAICVISLLCLSLKAGHGLSLEGAYEGRTPWIGWLWYGVSYCQGWKNWLGMDMQLYYPQDVPLWFIRDLMVMVVLSPVIHCLVRKGGAVYLGVVGLAYWLGILCCAPGLSTNALFFFSLGAFAALRNIEPVEWSRKNIKWLLPIFICLWIVASLIVEPGNAQPFENLMFTFGIPVSVWVGAAVMEKRSETGIPSSEVWKAMTDAGFFIYCIHMVNFGRWNLLAWVGKVGGLAFNLDHPVGAFLAYPSEILLIMGTGTLAYCLLRRYLPRLCNILMGGR